MTKVFLGFSHHSFKRFLSLFICIHLVLLPCASALDSNIISTPLEFSPTHIDSANTQSNSLNLHSPQAIHTPNLDSALPHSIDLPLIQPSLESNLSHTQSGLDFNISHLESIPHTNSLPHTPQATLPNPLESNKLESTPSLNPIENTNNSLHSTHFTTSPIDSLSQLTNTQPNVANLENLAHTLVDSLPITPDSTIPAYAPTISHSPNGIEIVEITTPNAKGISNNHYVDFNVKPQGVILNNSLESITHTQLAGLIPSNPHLYNSTASLILNQVTSTNPSHLLGLLEVAGTKANVLIANPNGIACKSCGFSNIANLTLSTALIDNKLSLDQKYFNHANSPKGFNDSNALFNLKHSINTANPTNYANYANSTRTTNANTTNQINTIHQTTNINHNTINNTTSTNQAQSLQDQLLNNLQARVQKGRINIDALNASNADTLTILAKSLKVDKSVYAKHLVMLLGSNDIALNDKGALLLWQPLEVKNLALQESSANQQIESSISPSPNNIVVKVDNGVKSPKESTNTNTTNEVLALDVAYLGGVFANSIYLIATDKDSLVSNKGVMATLPSTTKGDNGFYIDINGKLKIASNDSIDTINHNASNTNSHNPQAFQQSTINNNPQSTHNTSTQTLPQSHINTINNLSLRDKESMLDSLSWQSNVNATHTNNHTNQNPINTYALHNLDNKHSSKYASLYASNNLSINANSLTNTNSLIYANNALDINTDSLNNTKGSIYAGSVLNIHAHTLQNLGHTTTENELESKQWITKGNLTKVGDKHFWRSVYVDTLDSFSPSIIASNGNAYINANTLNNHNSYISANDSLQINAPNSSNTQTQAYQTIKEQGTEVRNYQYTYWEDYAGFWGGACGFITLGLCNIRKQHIITLQGIFPYSPTHSVTKIDLAFPTLQEQLERETKLSNAHTNITLANQHANNINAISHINLSSAYYANKHAFINSNYFYDSFAKRDSSQAKIFLANLDSTSKSAFFNSAPFLSNALDSHSLHTAYEHTLKQNRLKEHFTNLNNDISHSTNTYQNLIHSNLVNSIGFSANTLSINANTFSNDSILQGRNVAINAANTLKHAGNIEAKDIILQSNGLLHINGGNIDSNGNAYLLAKDIHIDSVINTNYGYANTTNQLGTNFTPFHSKDSLISTASINANNLSIIAKDSASIATANLHARDSLHINANSIYLAAQTLKSAYKDSYQAHDTTTALGTHLSANTLSLNANNTLNLTNSTLKADSNLALNTKGDISLDSALDSTYTQTTQHTRKQNLFYTKDTTTTTTTQSTTQKGNTLLSNGNLSIKSDKDISAHNLTAIANNDIVLESNQGDIALRSRANTYSQHISQHIVEKGFKGKLSDLSISYGTDKTNIYSTQSHRFYDKSLLYSNNISINTSKNARLESVDLSTYAKDVSHNNVSNATQTTPNNPKDNTISINANNLTMDYLSNTYKESYTSTTESHRVGLKASVPILSPALSASHSLDSLLNPNTNSPLHSTKAKALQSLNASLDIADLGLDIAKSINKDFNAKLSLSYTATLTTQQSNSTQTNALDSTINTANLSINTIKDTTLKGIQANISNTTNIQSTNFTLESSKDTFTHTQGSTLDSISVGASLSVGTNGIGINAEASYDNSRSKSSLLSTSYNHSNLNTQSFNLHTSNNTNILGSSITASNLSMYIGNTLDIASLQDSIAYNASSHSLSLSASIPVYGASSPSADASYSTSSSQAHLQTTTALASINADSLSINANHTNLLASSITGNGNLHTNSLTHSNLANTSSYDTNSTSIGTNGGYFLNNADSSTSSALATISNTINIQSNNNQTNNTLASSLQSLNRDTTKNNNITLKDYTQTAIDKQRENNQVGQLQLQLSQKAASITGDITTAISDYYYNKALKQANLESSKESNAQANKHTNNESITHATQNITNKSNNTQIINHTQQSQASKHLSTGDKWAEGGMYKSLAHSLSQGAIIALAGGSLSTSLSTTTSSFLTSYYSKEIQSISSKISNYIHNSLKIDSTQTKQAIFNATNHLVNASVGGLAGAITGSITNAIESSSPNTANNINNTNNANNINSLNNLTNYANFFGNSFTTNIASNFTTNFISNFTSSANASYLIDKHNRKLHNAEIEFIKDIASVYMQENNIESTPQNYYSTIELLFDSARTNVNALDFAPFTKSSEKQEAFNFLQDNAQNLYLYDDRGEYQRFFRYTTYQFKYSNILVFHRVNHTLNHTFIFLKCGLA